MKRIRFLTLIAILALVLCACGSKEDKPAPTSAPKTTEAPTAEVTKTPTAEPTAEITAEPTVEPTQDITAEVTETPTEEPTPEVTAEPTPEVQIADSDTWTMDDVLENAYIEYNMWFDRHMFTNEKFINTYYTGLTSEDMETIKNSNEKLSKTQVIETLTSKINPYTLSITNGREKIISSFDSNDDNIITICDNENIKLWSTDCFGYFNDIYNSSSYGISINGGLKDNLFITVLYAIVPHNNAPNPSFTEFCIGIDSRALIALNQYSEYSCNVEYEKGIIVSQLDDFTSKTGLRIMFNPETTGITIPKYIASNDEKDETLYTYVECNEGYCAIPKEGFDILTYVYDWSKDTGVYTEDSVWHLVPELTVTVNFGFETADGTIVTSGQ